MRHRDSCEAGSPISLSLDAFKVVECLKGRGVKLHLLDLGGSIRGWGAAINMSKSSVQRSLTTLAKKKLVEQLVDHWSLTAAGRKAIKGRSDAE